jgi:hypothetical protein
LWGGRKELVVWGGGGGGGGGGRDQFIIHRHGSWCGGKCDWWVERTATVGSVLAHGGLIGNF